MNKEKPLVSLTSIKEVVESGKIDQFLGRLAENLLLGDLLCGEAIPVEFLKDEFIRTYYEILSDAADQKAALYKQKASANH